MEKNITLEKKIIKASFIPDLISAFLIFIYILIPTLLITRLSVKIFIPLITMVTIMIFALQFILAPITDHIVYSPISKRLEHFKTSESSEAERTRLFEDVMHTPTHCMYKTFIYFFIGSIVYFLLYLYYLKLPITICFLAFFESIAGSIFASLYAYGYCNKICNKEALSILKYGVNERYLNQKKIFGIKLSIQLIVYLVLPMVINGTICFFIAFAGFYNPKNGLFESWIPKASVISTMVFTCIFNALIEIIMILFFFKRINNNNTKMRIILEEIDKGNTTEFNFVETTLEDEPSYNQYLANKMLKMLQGTLIQFEKIGHKLTEYSLNLGHISTETNSTYLEQSSGTNEILASMKITTEKSHQIMKNINEVSTLAEESMNNVIMGQENLDKYYANITNIASHNMRTSSEIISLSEKINKIWEVVTIINAITDQTKIIAFNAELESTGIKEKVGNFKNVSNEVRRLANSTMDSTHEIKVRINEIQNATDELKESLEKTIPVISKSMENIYVLKDNFTNILSSTKMNSDSARKVEELIKEQTETFDKVVNTLQEISEGLQNFDEATGSISNASFALQKSAGDLSIISRAGDLKHEE